MNNPPAFPSKRRIQRNGYLTNEYEPCGGMTLRDYFAAKAMQSYLNGDDRDIFTYDEWATVSYEMADAMLKERSK